VNIWVENENIGTTSEENGAFSIAASANKNLIFSILGFEKKVLKASEASNVIMKAASFQLDEVVVARHFETKKIEIGTINNSVLEAFDNGPRIDVKFFPYEAAYKKTKFIKKVSIFTPFLVFFRPDITMKFLNCMVLINSTKAFDWCMNCHIRLRTFFRFFGKYPPFGSK
jgi:hypothetical protein